MYYCVWFYFFLVKKTIAKVQTNSLEHTFVGSSDFFLSAKYCHPFMVRVLFDAISMGYAEGIPAGKPIVIEV